MWKSLLIVNLLFFHDSAIKREDEKAMESSLDEAMADSSFDTPVLFKPGMNSLSNVIFDYRGINFLSVVSEV